MNEFGWLNKLVACRLGLNALPKTSDIYEISPPELESASPLGLFVKENKLSFAERALIILALAPHIKPDFFDFYAEEYLMNTEISENKKNLFATRGKSYKGLLPTGLTYLYILGGNNTKKR